MDCHPAGHRCGRVRCRRYARVRQDSALVPASHRNERRQARSHHLGLQTGERARGEGSAVRWLRDRLRERSRAFSEIQPAYFAETQKGTDEWEELPDLGQLLEENFVLDERNRWTVPDPTKAHHLEQLRHRELLKEFE